MSQVLYDVPGPRTLRRIAVANWLVWGVFAVLIVVALLLLSQRGQLDPQLWSVLGNSDFHSLLGSGLLATLSVALVSMVLSVFFGLLLMVGLLSDTPWRRNPVRAWMEIFRGLPLLLLIFFIYLGAPAVGLQISTFWSLVLGITLYNSAVLAEIFRSGVIALARGQREAAYAIGLERGQTLRLVLLPQAVRCMLPALVSQMVIILKETSLGFIIGYTELLREGRTAVEYLGGQYSLPVYVAIAAIYILINLCLSLFAAWLNRRAAGAG